MAKEYVKLWISYQDYFEPLEKAEVGRLVLGMMRYQKTGEEPELAGNERFVWPAIRRDIDEAVSNRESVRRARSEAGRSGGRPKNGSKGFSGEREPEKEKTCLSEEANESKKSKSFSEKAKESNCFSEKAKKAIGLGTRDKGLETRDVSPSGDNAPLTPQGRAGGERPPKFSPKAYVEQYTQDAELRQLLLDWLDMRKKMRAPNTERAVAENLRILPAMAQQSGLSLQDYMRGIIRRGWRSFYPIRDGPPGAQKRDDGREFDWLTGQ